jgi:hypothetical protein
VSTQLLRPTVVVDLDGIPYSPESGTVTLDSGNVPYAYATIDLPFLDDATLDFLDPDNDVRVPFEAGDATETLRPFDLGLRGRVVDHERKTVTLTLASDESLLSDHKALTSDNGARAFESSVRAVCNYVLGKIGAVLEPGTDDADVTAYWSLTNLLTNPSAEVNTTGWGPGTGTSAIARITGAVPTTPAGTASFRWTASGAGQAFLSGTVSMPVNAGRSYIFSGYVLGTSPVRNIQPMIRFTNSSGETLREFYGTSFASSTSAWIRFVHSAVAPPGATLAVVHIRSVTNTAGQFHFADALMFYEGTETVAYFDGATTDTSHYTYDWDGDIVHGAPSTRTPVVERLPALFVWPPGTSAWDFLLTIMTVAGLILWCDEQRQWFLARPENRVIGTQVNVSASTARSGEDELSRDNPEAHATGIVVRFHWEDENGDQREAFDSAGTPEKVYVVDLYRPYPGPGIAAGMLARRQGTGRVQRVTPIARWTTTPGMSASISLPGAPDTLGLVTSVEFDLASGFMELGTAGLIDVEPGDWLAMDPATDWDDMPDATDWEDM